MNKLQYRLYEMMLWLHTLCEDNGLTYYMIGGTMLGAARHKGFIPWDDDMDIGMPRKDYERLSGILKNSDQNRYILETYKNRAKDFNYTFAKLYDTETTLIENTKYRTKRGIYIDIFPLDKMGDSLEESKAAFKKIRRKINLLSCFTLARSKDRSFYKNFAITLASLVPKPLVNTKRLIRKIDELCKSKENTSGKWMGVFLGVWGEKEIMPCEVFGEPVLYKFEDSYFYGVNMPDEYLKRLYGDWKQLPKEEKRVSHHGYLHMDLDRPYRK